MMLLSRADERKERHNFWLGGSTAAVAGLVNVASVIAFFAFSSNITGHVAILAEEVVKGHGHQMSIVFIWIMMFMMGAAVANFFVTAVGSRNVAIGHSAPLLLEMGVIGAVAYYGNNHYLETLKETEYLVSALLFAMGVQNGLVASVSNGVVKTTHLTGLFTDLGMEISMALQPRYRNDRGLHFKLKLHLIILAGYIGGGVLGAIAFMRVGFQAVYVGSLVLGLILVHDLIVAFVTYRQQAVDGVTETDAG